MFRWLAVCLALGLAPLRGVVDELRAQAPTGTQLLDFGPVFPGISAFVARTDAVRAGRFDIRGSARSEVRVTFVLPAALTASGGAVLPLQFGAGDGGYNTQNLASAALAFDPRVALVTRLGTPGRLYIWIGGLAMPSATQAAGLYQGTITVTVVYTGN